MKRITSSLKNAWGFPLPSRDDAGGGVESAPRRSIFNVGDPLGALPVSVADRYRVLLDERDEARGIWEVRRDASEAQRVRVRDAERDLTILREASGRKESVRQSDGSLSWSPGVSHEERLAAAEKRVETAKAEFARLNARTEEAHERYQAAMRAEVQAMRYIRAHADRVTAAAPVTIAKATPDALAKVLEEIAKLGADRHEIRSAPVPSSYAKARMRAEVDALANAGRPDVGRLIDIPDGEITWPEERCEISNGSGAVTYGRLPDATALVAWLYRDDLVARLDREIEDLADDGAALDEQTRAKKLAAIAEATLAAERKAVAIVDSLKAGGQWVAFPEHLDVRALLHADGPAVAE
ncbi:hypothetical protein [Alsobacter sp. R-9]